MRMMRAALAAVLLVPASGCALLGDDGAEEAAEELATALSSYDVQGVDFTEEDGDEVLRRLVAPLASYPSKVSVAGVTEPEDGKATATLRWTTDLGDQEWVHTGDAPLRKSGDSWQVVAGPTIVDDRLTEGEQVQVATLKAERGRILGARGQAIVEPRPVLRVGIDKTKAPAARLAQSARDLARVLEIEAPPLVKAVQAAGPKAFVEALVVRSEGLAPDYGTRITAIPGAVALADHRPLAPTREFARQLLGVVGPVTAEILEEAEGRLSTGDEAGLSGLQRRYDEQLAGTSGRVVTAVGKERRELFRIAPAPGKDLALTLDMALQQRADSLLQQTGSDSALVAIRPSTGEIVAAASGPADNGYSTATFGRFPPGSTFKIVSALALLRDGMAPTSRVRCPATTTVDGKRFKNYSDYPSSQVGTITLAEALAYSCNTAFVGQVDRLPTAELRQAAADLGLGVDHDLGFPAYFGGVPEPGSKTEAAADLIGQGRVTASPMAMAAVLASVVRGETVVPHLLDGRGDPRAGQTDLQPEEVAQLRAMLRGVVADGSGQGLQGVADLAKTGTAEFGDASKTHAWMVGARDDLAVAVFVAEGESGSRTAGPILREFLSRG